jgi:hypothetical protein
MWGHLPGQRLQIGNCLAKGVEQEARQDVDASEKQTMEARWRDEVASVESCHGQISLKRACSICS